jgi:hypothetical protein
MIHEASELKHRRREEISLQKLAEKQRFESAQKELAGAMVPPPLDADLVKLMLAIDAARKANVEDTLVTDAEAKLRDAAKLQGQRNSVEARLRALLVSRGPVDPGVLEGEKPDTGTAPENGPPADEHARGASASELLGVDLQALHILVEEGRAASASEKLIEEVLELAKRVNQAQLGVSAQTSMFHVKQRRKGILSKWQATGGEERLKRAQEDGKAALELYESQAGAAPLRTAIESLFKAITETINAGIDKIAVEDAEGLLLKLRVAARDLERVQTSVQNAIDTTSEIASYAAMKAAEKKLTDAVNDGRAAHIDAELIRRAEDAFQRVRNLIRAASKAEERLMASVAFCNEHLQRFYHQKPTQLKTVAVPSVESALALARGALVNPDRIREGEEMVREATQAKDRVEEATQWLSTVCKASVRALDRAAEDKVEAPSILQVAVESLASAIQNAKDDSVEPEDVASAELLFSTVHTSWRRAVATAKGAHTKSPAVIDRFNLRSDPRDDPELQA